MKRTVFVVGALGALLAAVPARAELLPWPVGQSRFALTPPRLFSEDRALRDIYVLPVRPGQNRVAYWDYDWRTYEFNTDRGGGGVRLYLYDRERDAGSYAVASIREQYVRLTDLFHYLPRSTIPFILYASYAEFQATNVFFISEGTLGATDPRDLRMAMPFFGNVRQFSRISTHEMAHQFTVQKVRDVGLRHGLDNPLGAFPLWFIEGLAEYATFGGMDEEGDYILRDLVTNPDPMKGYALPQFFNDRAGGYIGVYKLGQARLTFIGETYGHEKVLALLERSGELVGAPESYEPAPPARPQPPGGTPEDASRAQAQPAGAKPAQAKEDQGLPPESGADEKPKRPVPGDFQGYVAMVLGEPAGRIEERYAEWMKKRYYRDYLDSQQSVAAFREYRALDGEPDSFSLADDGHLLLYRTVERDTGQAALYLQDVRDPTSRRRIARDQVPGLESLHPVDRRVTAVGANRLVYAGRSGRTDVLYLQRVERAETQVAGKVRVRLKVSSPEAFELGEVLEVYDPALSPDGKRVAFAGIDPSGFRDLYLLTLEGPNKGALERLTDDVWAEADLAWDGARLLYISDRTDTKEFNLFALDLATLQTSRLTWHAREDRNPVPALGGVVFRSMQSGKPDLWLLKDGQETRLTDTPSAMLAAAPTTGGALYALGFHSGQYRMWRVPEKALLRQAPTPAQPQAVGGSGLAVAHSLFYPRAEIPGYVPGYRPGQSSNWRVEASAAALVGPTSVGAAGLAVTDVLRDHLMLINLAIYGSLKLTDASVFYINQARRPELGIGAFHTFEPRRDKTFPGEDNFYLQRQFGVGGLMRYAVDRFRRLEGSLELRGIERFGFTDYTGDLNEEWERMNSGVEPELVASAQFGYDTTRLHMLAGPVEGRSLMFGLSGGYLPVRDYAYVRAMADGQQRWRIVGRSNLMLRAAGGGTSGGRFSPQFYLSSVGNMEGFRFGDERLLGDWFYVSNLRLTIPIDQLVFIPLFTGMYGVAGMDFGATFDDPSTAWTRRSLSAVLGTDLALGALVLQLHFGRLIDVGGSVNSGPWVFNLAFKYLYF